MFIIYSSLAFSRACFPSSLIPAKIFYSLNKSSCNLSLSYFLSKRLTVPYSSFESPFISIIFSLTSLSTTFPVYLYPQIFLSFSRLYAVCVVTKIDILLRFLFPMAIYLLFQSLLRTPVRISCSNPNALFHNPCHA